MLTSYKHICSLSNYEINDSQVSIGVVDSLYKPVEAFREDHTVAHTVDRTLKSGDDDDWLTAPHGWYVRNIIDTYTNNDEVIWNFYRVVEPDQHGRLTDKPLMWAIRLAMDHGVDVLNISMGSDHISSDKKSCNKGGPNCALSQIVEEAVEDGLTIVAAVGNAPYTSNIACPAFQPRVIGVGGFIPKCTAPGNPIPPGALWLVNPDIVDDDEELNPTPICSTLGCGVGEYCSENRLDEYWSKNPERLNNKPDILAPVHIAVDTLENNPKVKLGTSFAAPIVTAQVANFLLVYRHEGIDVSSDEIRKGLVEGGKPVKGADAPRISGKGGFNAIGDEYGLTHEETEQDVFDTTSLG